MPAPPPLLRLFFAVLAATLPCLTVAAPFAYISNRLSATVSVIDTATNAAVATIPVVGLPVGVAANSAGTRVYVANSTLVNNVSSRVSVIDTATNAVLANVPLGEQAYGIAVNPGGTRVYVTNTKQGSNTVSVMDTATNAVIANVPVGISPMSAAVDPAGTRVYVTNGGSDNVSVIDVATNAVVGTVQVGGGPVGVDINGTGSRVYVANQVDDTVSVIDPTTLRVVATIPVGDSPMGIAINAAGTFAYVVNQVSHSVSIIDTATNAVVGTVGVASNPRGISLNPAGTRAYVTNYGSNNVSVIDTGSRTVIATVPVGSGPYALGRFIAQSGAPPTTPPPAPAARELTFTPLAPCRLVDTRNAVGALAPRAGRGYSASDPTRIGAAGGQAAGCGVPNGPAALALTITAVAPSQAGNLVAYPAGTGVPLASSLNFLGGQTIANTTIVPITPGTGDNFALFNNSDGNTNVVVDAVGYFWEYAASDCAKVSQPQSIGAGSSAAVVASCSAGYVPAGGGCSASAAGAITWLDRRNTSNGAGYSCRALNGSGAPAMVTTDVLCCRKAGR